MVAGKSLSFECAFTGIYTYTSFTVTGNFDPLELGRNSNEIDFKRFILQFN